MLGHRLRRWPNIKPALNKRIVFADYCRSCNIREVLIFAIFSRGGQIHEFKNIAKVLL